jgi:hypothetical protein
MKEATIAPIGWLMAKRLESGSDLSAPIRCLDPELERARSQCDIFNKSGAGYWEPAQSTAGGYYPHPVL